jgi:hypothetical protein
MDILGTSHIDKALKLKYAPCSQLFSPEFLQANAIEPDWIAAKISGQEYQANYLIKSGYKNTIPSSVDYTVYNVQRKSSRRQLKIFHCHYNGCSRVVSTLSKFFAHLRCHTQDKPYKCPEDGCGMSFT